MIDIIPNFLSGFLLLFLKNVHAYIDPGSTSAILAVIISVLVGFGVTIKTQWIRIKSKFSTKKTE